MEAKKLPRLSIKEYIELEQESNIKYEYHDGWVYAMAGGSINHAIIVGNTFSAANTALMENNSPCYPLNSEAKLHLAPHPKFVYPDAMVVCGDLKRSEWYAEAILNPVVIIEVLSTSTESYDRGDKFYFYRHIESLKEYILIDQYKPLIEKFTRESELWDIARITGMDNAFDIEFLGISISLELIYRNVAFEDPESGNNSHS